MSAHALSLFLFSSEVLVLELNSADTSRSPPSFSQLAEAESTNTAVN